MTKLKETLHQKKPKKKKKPKGRGENKRGEWSKFAGW